MNATDWTEDNNQTFTRKDQEGHTIAFVTPSMGLWTGKVCNGRDAIALHQWPDLGTADAAKHHVDVQLRRMGYFIAGDEGEGAAQGAPVVHDRAQQDALEGRTTTETAIANLRTNPEIVPHPVKPEGKYVHQNNAESSDKLGVAKTGTGGNMTPVGHDRVAATETTNDTPSSYVPGDGFKAQVLEDSTNVVRDDGVVPQAIEKEKVDKAHDSVAPKSHKSNWPKSNRF